jgi:predicted transcriptional regulator
MMAQGLSLLPVSSEAGTVIGVVRMDDLFHEITNRVLRL